MYIVSYILYGYKAITNKKIEDYLPQTTTTTVCLHTTTALGKLQEYSIHACYALRFPFRNANECNHDIILLIVNLVSL